MIFVCLQGSMELGFWEVIAQRNSFKYILYAVVCWILLFAGTTVVRSVSMVDKHWYAEVEGRSVPYDASISLVQLFGKLCTNVCEGNADEEYRCFNNTPYSANCKVLNLTTSTSRCSSCTLYRGTLRKQLSRKNAGKDSSAHTAASSSTPLSSLPHSLLLDRARNIAREKN